MAIKEGERVFAVRNADEDTVYLYGYGVYEGRKEGSPLSGFPNPKIKLDDGQIVWGCECWFGAESAAEKYISLRKVETVPAPGSQCSGEPKP